MKYSRIVIIRPCSSLALPVIRRFIHDADYYYPNLHCLQIGVFYVIIFDNPSFFVTGTNFSINPEFSIIRPLPTNEDAELMRFYCTTFMYTKHRDICSATNSASWIFGNFTNHTAFARNPGNLWWSHSSDAIT